MRRLIVIASLLVLALAPTAAFADDGGGYSLPRPGSETVYDPITCPPGQESVKVGTVWACVNNGDSGNPNTEETKNPND